MGKDGRLYEHRRGEDEERKYGLGESNMGREWMWDEQRTISVNFAIGAFNDVEERGPSSEIS